MKKNLDILAAVLVFAAMVLLSTTAFGQTFNDHTQPPGYDLGTQVDEDKEIALSQAWALERDARWKWSNGTMYNQDWNTANGGYGKWIKEEVVGEIHAQVRCGLKTKFNFVVQAQLPGDSFSYTLPDSYVEFTTSGTYYFYSVDIPEVFVAHCNCPGS